MAVTNSVIPKHVLTAGDVARILGVTGDWVRRLDDELKPIQLDSGHRRYDPRIVAKFVKRRAAVRAAR